MTTDKTEIMLKDEQINYVQKRFNFRPITNPATLDLIMLMHTTKR